MRAWLMLALLAAGACDSGSAATIPAADRGRELFSDPGFSPSEFNVFSCATCHPSTPGDPPGPAYNLVGVTDRKSWWGGSFTNIYDAADFCYRYFMRGFPKLDATTDDSRALFEYLASLSTGAALPTLPITTVETIAVPPAGDAEAGKAIWDHECRGCHGDPVTGNGALGPAVSVVPGASQALATQLGVDPALVVTEKIRHGSFFGVGGNMPFFPLEVITDDDLADLMEYINP